MSELHTNTDTDADKYILNGVEATPNEVIEIMTNFLNAQQSRVIRLKARIAELEAAQRWTPVEHGLPSGYPCLVVLKNGNIKIDFTFLDGGNYYWWNSGQANVTHWMPLPPNPEVEE